MSKKSAWYAKPQQTALETLISDFTQNVSLAETSPLPLKPSKPAPLRLSTDPTDGETALARLEKADPDAYIALKIRREMGLGL